MLRFLEKYEIRHKLSSMYTIEKKIMKGKHEQKSLEVCEKVYMIVTTSCIRHIKGKD